MTLALAAAFSAPCEARPAATEFDGLLTARAADLGEQVLEIRGGASGAPVPTRIEDDRQRTKTDVAEGAGIRRGVDTPQKIVVDGYNVIYADDALRKTAGSSIEKSRRKLLSMLSSYLSDKNLRMTVVFDGRGGLADAEAVIPGKLKVIYSARNQSADELIVAMIGSSANPRSHIVVTSDRAHIRPAVSEIGCAVIESKDFLERIRRKPRRRRGGSDDEKPAGGPEELDYWLERFERGS